MKRLRSFLVAGLLMLAIPTAVVLAAKPTTTGLDNAMTHASKTLPANGGSNRPDTGQVETQGERPHNHGWFVSQVARDHSTTGRAHGEAVSAIARGSQGKPDSAD